MNNQKKVEWSKLDNASKYFPATCDERDPKVFRIACELFEDVEPEILQKALDITIEQFPSYKSVLRRGIFWYYYESSDIRPTVEREDKPVCAPIYRKNEKNLLFRVIYNKKRINIEVFHALSDGTGALWFMMTLLYHYLLIKYKDDFLEKKPELNYNASISQKKDDSFSRYYQGRHYRKQAKTKKENKNPGKVYIIRGTRLEENRIKVIEGTMSAKAVLEEAHKYNTTLTVFLSALLLLSIYKDMPVRKRGNTLVLAVPINLRQFFKSETSSNFFSIMNIPYTFDDGNTELKDVIGKLDESFRKELTEERIYQHLHWLMSFERNPFTRIAPLPLKNLSLRIANAIADLGVTTSISNLGKIKTPPEFDRYIRQFSVIPNVRRPQMAICTYGDRLVINFASPFRETEIQRFFFESLANMGIKIEIASN